MSTKIYHTDCRHFTGYKPCSFKRACEGCPHFERPTSRIVIVSLEALGAVLRSTVLLRPLKKAFPGCHITWITLPSAAPLLENNALIDRIMPLSDKLLSAFSYMKFDLCLGVDKSIEAGALVEKIVASEKRGFGLTETGAIRPLNSEASELYELGLDDDFKFFRNQKPETRLITEAMALSYGRDEYILDLTKSEQERISQIKLELMSGGAKGIIGYNTGCSVLYSYKKLTVPKAIETIQGWRTTFPEWKIALLGGREDAERQAEMKAAFANDPFVVNTPTAGGLRNGVLWMAAADVVFSGCSLGLHIAIALKKQVVCWFGVSCAQEIELYDRGVKLLAEVSCSPCWKKSCDKTVKCYDQVPVAKIIEATKSVMKSLK
jgi:heptosyltransferase-2